MRSPGLNRSSGGLLRLLAPRERIVFLAVVSLLAVAVDQPPALAVGFSAMAGGYLTAGLSSRAQRLWLVALAFMTWGTMFSQALFYAQLPRQILFTILPESFPLLGPLTGGIHVYLQGLEHGLLQSLRFGLTLTAGFWVCFCTEPRDILTGATSLRLPRRLAFMLMTGLRFVPLITREAFTVIQAQRLRGVNPARRVFWAPVRTARQILEPVLAGCVRRSGTLALSAELRGFSTEGDRVAIVTPANLVSRLVGLLLLVSGVSLLLAKALLWLYLGGLFYLPELRPLYAFCEEYL